MNLLGEVVVFVQFHRHFGVAVGTTRTKATHYFFKKCCTVMTIKAKHSREKLNKQKSKQTNK